jgi:hypothetical protein
MTTAEREAFDAMLACLCGFRMLVRLEALVDKQSKWEDILPLLDSTIAQAQGAIK